MQPDSTSQNTSIQRWFRYVSPTISLYSLFRFTYLPIYLDVGVTNNVITSQVASGLLRGLFPSSPSSFSSMHSYPFPQAFIQPSSIDSLEPKYSCSKASSIRNAITSFSDPAGKQWKDHLDKAKAVYAKLDEVSGIPTDDGGGWHVSFDQ